MKLLVLLIAVGVAVGQGVPEEERDKRQSGYYQGQGVTRGPIPKQFPTTRFPGVGGPSPQGFRAAPVDEDDEEDVVSRNTVAPSPGPQALLLVRQSHPTPQPQQQVYRRPVANDNARDYQQPIPVARPQPQQQQVRRPQQQGGRGGPFPNQQLQEEELEEEKEEPDRLSLLLPQSKFDCLGKKTGYYADDGLNCEVFHYCQDNARHSWICPEGFLFHQVHLICMPPSGDNICQQSSQYHFVNDYLYRPINAEEAQTKPNVTLRYSDRYYPDSYYDPAEDQPQGAPQRSVPQQQPQPRPAPVPTTPRGRPVQLQPTLRPVQFAPPQFRQAPPGNQVFHSPEEVNIPLQQRRPAPSHPQRGFPGKDDEFEYDDSPFRG